VDLVNPYASSTESPGFNDFTELVSDPDELKALTFFSINGSTERAHPLYGGALPHALMLGLTPRSLTTVCFSNVHLPCAELPGFLLWSPAQHIRFSNVSFTPNPKGRPLCSNKSLQMLELCNVPHKLVDELVRGINSQTKGFHLKLHPEGNKVFRDSLWTSIFPRTGRRPSVGSITSVTFAGSPVFCKPCSVFSDLINSNVCYLGLEDAQFDEHSFVGLLGLVGDPDGHLRSLRVRYWNTEISNNAHNGSEFHRFLRAIGRSKIKEYIHEGISCDMANIVANHLPTLGLSACHLEVTPPPKKHKSLSGLAVSPADELIAAARKDRTLGVFDESDFSNNIAGGPYDVMPQTVLFPYDKKPQLVGLSAIGIKCRVYGDSGVTPAHWELFSEDQLDTLSRLVKRNQFLFECDRAGHHLPAPSAVASPTNKIVAKLNSIVYGDNLDWNQKITFKAWSEAVLHETQFFSDYNSEEEDDAEEAAGAHPDDAEQAAGAHLVPVFCLPSPSSLATTASIHSSHLETEDDNDDADNDDNDTDPGTVKNANGKRTAPL
jgi:hypothetical protein